MRSACIIVSLLSMVAAVEYKTCGELKAEYRTAACCKALANKSTMVAKLAPVPHRARNVCWKPLLEMDGRGFLYAQQHVAAFLQRANSTTLVMNSALPDMSRATPPMYDYRAEIHTLIGKLAGVTTQTQKDEISFFDGKLNIALGIIGTLMLGYGQSIEEIMWHSFGETSSVYDSGVAVWKNKLINSRIRPTTAIQQLYPGTSFTINDGVSVEGRHFQALVRVMPHSEYPSGSSCVCQAIEEYLADLWPSLNLVSQGNPVAFDPAMTPVILPNVAMANVPLTGARNPAALGFTARTLNLRCGETREEAGLHFAPAVPAGRALCAGMGSIAAARTKELIPGVTDGEVTVRAAINASAPCEAMCCASEVACDADEQAACAAKCTGVWDMPWYDVVSARVAAFGLPDRMTATTLAAPFFQTDRNHLAVVAMMAAVVPEILKSETIFQFRYTNTVDNLVWNAIAANSASLKALHFGQSHYTANPIVRSGQTSSDARVVTAVHAVAAALTLLLPSATADFEASLGYALLSPTIGFVVSLTAACGLPSSATTSFSAECLKEWYGKEPGPSRLGQIIAYEVMYFKVRDGWNSLGTDDGCDGGPHFCHRYADVTKYDPEVGQCLRESLAV